MSFFKVKECTNQCDSLRRAAGALVQSWDAREFLAPHIENLRKALTKMNASGDKNQEHAHQEIQEALERFDAERGRE